MKIRTIAIVMGTLLLVPALWSQVSSTGAQSPARIGTISLRVAILNTAEGKQASQELQTQFASRSAELQNMQEQMQDLQTRLQAGPTLSDEERDRLQRQGERLTRTLQQKQQYFQEDLNAAQQDVMNNIGQKMADVLSKYSKENGYTVVLDTSSQDTPVVYAVPQLDITQEIIRTYDQAHPVRASTITPAKPVTP